MYRDIRNLSGKRVREKVDQLLYSSNAYVPRIRIIILNYKKKKKFQSFPRYIEISTSIKLSSIRVLTVFIRDKWGSAVFRIRTRKLSRYNIRPPFGLVSNPLNSSPLFPRDLIFLKRASNVFHFFSKTESRSPSGDHPQGLGGNELPSPPTKKGSANLSR